MNIQIIADHIIADSAVKSVMKFLNILQNWKLKRKKVKQMIKIGLALIGVVVFVGLYACVVAGKNADNAMHDYFEKYK